VLVRRRAGAGETDWRKILPVQRSTAGQKAGSALFGHYNFQRLVAVERRASLILHLHRPALIDGEEEAAPDVLVLQYDAFDCGPPAGLLVLKKLPPNMPLLALSVQAITGLIGKTALRR